MVTGPEALPVHPADEWVTPQMYASFIQWPAVHLVVQCKLPN